VDAPKRLTDRAFKVMQLAERIAVSLGHPAVEPEHVLFGLVEESEGIAAYVLRTLGANLESLRWELKAPRSRADPTMSCALPISPATEQLMLWATEELLPLGHSYVGTEHMVLALTHLPDCVCAQIISAHGIMCADIRRETYAVLGYEGADKGSAFAPRSLGRGEAM
jgi:ATP-dependent Clp protease ATP-binding subunit ClpC